MKPMLAAKFGDVRKPRYPYWGSVKVDGIRCLISTGCAVSRSLKPIPNHHVQKWARDNARLLEGCDGELVVGDLTAPDCFRRTSSGVMSEDGEPDFTFFAFDLFNMGGEPYRTRHMRLLERKDPLDDVPRFVVLYQVALADETQVGNFAARRRAEGHEGIMLRAPEQPYKFGRSGTTDQGLLKLKAWEDAEATVVAVHEEQHNANEATTDNLGHTARSSHQENMVGKGALGALEVESPLWAVRFRIGTGFDAADRRSMWDSRLDILGKVVKFKYFPLGSKEAPRFPVFLGFRDKRDM